MSLQDESEGLRKLLETEYSSVLSVLDAVRRRRLSIEQLATNNLRRTQHKLREASDTTRVAATDILDGLDRAIEMVDTLDACAVTAGDADGRALDVRSELRDVLFELIGSMQFQDIASQQLANASAVLSEVETKLTDIAAALHLPRTTASGSMEAISPPSDDAVLPVVFDPNATMLDREERQANADLIYYEEIGHPSDKA